MSTSSLLQVTKRSTNREVEAWDMEGIEGSEGCILSQLPGWATGIHSCWGALGDGIEYASKLPLQTDKEVGKF